MRSNLCLMFLLAFVFSGNPAGAADKSGLKKDQPLVNVPDGTPEKSRFSDAQLVFVQSWIKQKTPECPAADSAIVAENFLEELQRNDPGLVARLLTPEFPAAQHESALLRQVALKLTGSSFTTAREELAVRRVAALLVAEGREPLAAKTDAANLIGKIREGSRTQYRRLVDGRIENDELQLLFKKVSQVNSPPKEPTPRKPKVLTAAEILTEFTRRNQTGSALQRLQGFVVEGKIRTANGEEQELLMFKMRPDAFRLVVRTGGATRYIMAANGGRFWQQVPGKAPQAVPAQALGQRRYLAEFVDPLFLSENYTFERGEDGTRADGKKFYRIKVRRTDGTGYIAQIDEENFRQIGRENEDGTMATYSDFREVGGVIYAFREEIRDEAGKNGDLEIVRISPNPGLIPDLFEPPARPELGYFELEAALAPTTPAKFN